MTLRIRPEARVDLLDAVRWYEDRETGLGAALVSEIDAVFHRVALGPSRFRTAYRGLRVALSHRFPYAVYYLEEDDDVVILAILHQRRDRKVLDTRIDDR
ncbi:MAG: type II toxin-antitoxin system RelE/ParE family toxin [Hyphomicrobium aestuarii]|nr:type II toxin-antitoxin system RelE/ParE family toxin [Hyphomicrobium aestuarii]